MTEPTAQEILAAIDGAPFDVYRRSCYSADPARPCTYHSLPMPGWPDRPVTFADLRRVLKDLMEENAVLVQQVAKLESEQTAALNAKLLAINTSLISNLGRHTEGDG